MIRRLIVTLFIGLITFDVSALDTEIRVLAVITANAVNDVNISQQLNQIEIAWNNSSVPTINSMRLVNVKDGAGNPVKPVLTGPPLVTTFYEDTHTALLSGAYNLAALRDQVKADLVVVFVPGSALSGACGFAPMRNWTDVGGPGVFVPDFDLFGLDIGGSETFFLAIMSTNAACTQIQANNNNAYNVAHELGHLFGAGHDTAATPIGFPPAVPRGFYLFRDSRAHVYQLPIGWGITLAVKTVLARPDALIQPCLSSTFGSCILAPVYSKEGGIGDGAHDNVKTLAFTASSIANYRPIPTGCSLTRPTDVVGVVTHTCWFNTGLTRHKVVWNDACPDATEYYKVHRSLISILGPYEFGWTTSIQRTAIFNNIDGWVKVKACNSSGCSRKSKSLYFAPALCVSL